MPTKDLDFGTYKAVFEAWYENSTGAYRGLLRCEDDFIIGYRAGRITDTEVTKQAYLGDVMWCNITFVREGNLPLNISLILLALADGKQALNLTRSLEITQDEYTLAPPFRLKEEGHYTLRLVVYYVHEHEEMEFEVVVLARKKPWTFPSYYTFIGTGLLGAGLSAIMLVKKRKRGLLEKVLKVGVMMRTGEGIFRYSVAEGRCLKIDLLFASALIAIQQLLQEKGEVISSIVTGGKRYIFKPYSDYVFYGCLPEEGTRR